MDMIKIYDGKEIGEIRKKAKMSRADLASKLGTSESAVARWENENRTPRLSKMAAISKIAEEVGYVPSNGNGQINHDHVAV